MVWNTNQLYTVHHALVVNSITQKYVNSVSKLVEFLVDKP